MCVVSFYDPTLVNHYGPRVCSQESQGGANPRIGIAGVPPQPVLTQTTWGSRILSLQINYVAGYTCPLLFLFERTHNYYVGNQGLVP